MALLIGRYEYSLDPKHRVAIPPKFREALIEEKGQNFYLTSGLEGCLFLFLPSKWNTLMENDRFSQKNKEEERAFKRKFFSEASEVTLDSAGRILIPEYLRLHAGLKSKILVQGVGTRAEIWDSNRWQSYNKSKVEPTYRRVSRSLEI